MVLPEIDKCPVKPKLDALFWLFRMPVFECVRLDCFEAGVFAQAGHARDKLVGSDAGVQDGMQCRASDFARLSIEFVANTEQECA